MIFVLHYPDVYNEIVVNIISAATMRDQKCKTKRKQTNPYRLEEMQQM
jgi:hypothetical protein